MDPGEHVTLSVRKVSVMLAACTGLAGMAASATAWGQGRSSRELAQLLANDGTRQSAIAQIKALGNDVLPVLLAWAQNPPGQLDEDGLYIGLADAFGELRAAQAIPFLRKNITLRRTRYVDLNPWLKSPEVIETTFPAIAALIKIGPEAAKDLVTAARGPLTMEDRLAFIFVIARISRTADVPEARGFLVLASSEANQERYWAQEGLNALNRNASPGK